MFKNLVRKSRVFSLPEVKPHSKDVPSQQILSTTSANHHRNNWGIKYNLPSKASAGLVTHGSLDSEISMPRVDYGGSHARRVQKLVESGIAAPDTKSMFQDQPRPKKRIVDLSRKEIKSILDSAPSRRDEFLATYGNSVKTVEAENFYGLTTSNLAHTVPITTVGVTYALKGACHNTRDGLQRAKWIPGRLLPRGQKHTSQGNSHGQVAAAGFVGPLNSSRYDTSMVPQQAKHSVRVSECRTNGTNGALQLKFSLKME